MFVRLYPKDIKTVNMDTDKIYKTIFFFILMSLVSKVYALDLKALNDSIEFHCILTKWFIYIMAKIIFS